jgi:hypothetical protein
MALAVKDLFEICIIRDILDAFSQRDYLIVARHDDDSAKLQSLCEMHRADREARHTKPHDDRKRRYIQLSLPVQIRVASARFGN